MGFLNEDVLELELEVHRVAQLVQLYEGVVLPGSAYKYFLEVGGLVILKQVEDGGDAYGTLGLDLNQDHRVGVIHVQGLAVQAEYLELDPIQHHPTPADPQKFLLLP